MKDGPEAKEKARDEIKGSPPSQNRNKWQGRENGDETGKLGSERGLELESGRSQGCSTENNGSQESRETRAWGTGLRQRKGPQGRAARCLPEHALNWLHGLLTASRHLGFPQPPSHHPHQACQRDPRVPGLWVPYHREKRAPK